MTIDDLWADVEAMQGLLRDHHEGGEAPPAGATPDDERYFTLCMHSEPVGTTTGCECEHVWFGVAAGAVAWCFDYCCNPDADPGGIWCFTTATCSDSWGYCSARGSVALTAQVRMPLKKKFATTCY